jgi:8-oxo-dGTP pyrophosphatase MutT (NUDIX family)
VKPEYTQIPLSLSAGFVLLRSTPAGPRLLILRAYRNWDFPKGNVEPGETPIVAARRETDEEAGIVDVELPLGELYAETAPYGRGKIARYYLGTTRTARVVLGINPRLGRPEHHEYRWVSPAEAQELLPPRLQPVLAWALGRLPDLPIDTASLVDISPVIQPLLRRHRA